MAAIAELPQTPKRPEQSPFTNRQIRNTIANWIREGSGTYTLQLKPTTFEQRALSSGTAATGGNTVESILVPPIVETMTQSSSVMRLSRNVVITRPTHSATVAITDDSNKTGQQVNENVAVSQSTDDLTFNALTVSPYKYSTKRLDVSIELFQDSDDSLIDIVATALGKRIGRTLNDHLTNGNGSSQPQGVVTAATDSSLSAALSVNHLLDLKASVDPEYQDSPSAAFMVSPANFTAMKKLFAGNMTLQTSASNVGPQHFFDGSLVVQNKNLGDSTILFGDWANYVTVIFRDLEVRLLEHRVVDAHQVSFIAFARFGGGLAVPAAIKKATVS